MAFTTNPYCVVSDVQTMLNLSVLTTPDTTAITYLIPQAQAEVDRYVGYSFQTDGTVSVPATRLYDGRDSAYLVIDRCAQIIQVLESPWLVTIGSFGYTQVAQSTPLDITTDCFLRMTDVGFGRIMARYSGIPFNGGVQNYTVKGVFGAPSIPTTITRACALLAAHYFRVRDVGYSMTAAQAGSAKSSVHYALSMPSDVQDILNLYRGKLLFAGYMP